MSCTLTRSYAASSEKLSPDQVSLFDEAECDANLDVEEQGDTETVSVPAHTRKKRGRVRGVHRESSAVVFEKNPRGNQISNPAVRKPLTLNPEV